MKAQIYLDNKLIFKSNKISAINLDKKADELMRVNNCQKMADIVKRGFMVFTTV